MDWVGFIQELCCSYRIFASDVIVYRPLPSANSMSAQVLEFETFCSFVIYSPFSSVPYVCNAKQEVSHALFPLLWEFLHALFSTCLVWFSPVGLVLSGPGDSRDAQEGKARAHDAGATKSKDILGVVSLCGSAQPRSTRRARTATLRRGHVVVTLPPPPLHRSPDK